MQTLVSHGYIEYDTLTRCFDTSTQVFLLFLDILLSSFNAIMSPKILTCLVINVSSKKYQRTYTYSFPKYIIPIYNNTEHNINMEEYYMPYFPSKILI